MGYVDASRYQVRDGISSQHIASMARDRKLRVVQTSSPLSDHTWDKLNTELFRLRPDIELRVFGFHKEACDLGFVSQMTHVRCFSADCIDRVTNLEVIGDHPDLEELTLGVRELESFDILHRVNDRLTRLSLLATKSKKPDLDTVGRFRGLRRLFLEGHTKNIDTVAELSDLERITLRSVTTSNLGFLSGLTKLWWLDLKLGGTTDLSALADLDSLKHLEIWQVRGLSDISVIAELGGLQDLFLQSLPSVVSLPPLDRSTHLRRVVLDNMKGLHDLSPLKTAPALEEFAFFTARPQSVEDVAVVLRNPAMQRAGAYFGSDRRNDEFVRLALERGIASFERVPFNYE